MIESNCDDYKRIERALLFLEENAGRQPTLAELAREIHLSEFHFQRLFKRWAGITPKRFLQIVTLELAKESLAQSRNVLEASWDAGLSGPGRLHDLFVSIEAVTPGEFKALGEGLAIQYGFHDTKFGRSLIGTTLRGICHLSFIDNGSESAAERKLRAAWPAARFCRDDRATEATLRTAGILPASIRKDTGRRDACGTLLVAGTNFQARVWRALVSIPSGTTVTYAELARSIGQPKAARAVGSAVAANSIAYLIPCHRVIRQLGITGQYRWGPARKKVMLAWEVARKSYADVPPMEFPKKLLTGAR